MKPQKIISLLLVASLSFGAITGCADADEIGATVDESVSSISPVIQEKPIDTLDSCYSYLESLNPVDVKAVLASPDDYSNLEVAKAGYDNLKANNVDLTSEDVINELNNILMYALYPMGLTEEEYEVLVGRLASTLGKDQNAFMCYYSFAAMRHLAECPEKHEQNEFGKVNCPTIAKMWDERGTQNIEETLENEFAGDEAYLRIKKALSNNPTLTMEDYLNELENLVMLSLAPTDFYSDEEWFALFGNLERTLSAEESLYDTYIVFAIKVHNLLNPENIIDFPEDIVLERA